GAGLSTTKLVQVVLVARVACKVESPKPNCRWRSAASPGSAGFTLSSTINLQRFCSLCGHSNSTDRLPSFLGSAIVASALRVTRLSPAWQFRPPRVTVRRNPECRLGQERTYKRRPIGVFDSGVGGLTVVRALRGVL